MEERVLRQDVDALREDLGQLKSDIGDLTRDLLDRARDGMGEARGRMGDAFGMAQDRGQEMLETVKHQIEDRPVTSVFVALGVGLVLGALLRK